MVLSWGYHARLSREYVQIMGHITLKTTCAGVDARAINVNYLILDIMSPYNVMLGRMTINILGTVISMLYLTLKYLLLDGQVGIIRRDQQTARECYLSILETTKGELSLLMSHFLKFQILT